VADVVVADAHDIGVAERAEADLGRRPCPDQRECPKASIRVGQRQVGALLGAHGVGRGEADRVRAVPFQPQRVVGIAGQPGKRLRVRWNP
jgi:hypothetical protein